MVLVVGVENDLLVGSISRGNGGPPGLETGSISNDVVVVAAVVVRSEHSISSLARDVADGLVQNLAHVVKQLLD